MTELLNSLQTLHFSSPLFLLLSVPCLAALVYQIKVNRKQYAFATSDIGSLALSNRSRLHGICRAVLLALSAILFATAIADPRIITTRYIPQANHKELFKHLLVLLDISYSMSISTGEDNKSGPTRYQVARESFREIVGKQRDARVSLILFSNDPLVVTYPSRDTKFLKDVLFQDDISDSDPSQMYLLSGGTNTPKAFLAADKILQDPEYANDKVFLLITDLFDNPLELIDAMKSLREKGVRIYVLGVGTNESVAREIQQAFVGDNDIRVFSATSEIDIKEVFSIIADIEYQRDISTLNHAYDASLKFYVAVTSYLTLLLSIFFSENIFLSVVNRHKNKWRAQ